MRESIDQIGVYYQKLIIDTRILKLSGNAWIHSNCHIHFTFWTENDPNNLYCIQFIFIVCLHLTSNYISGDFSEEASFWVRGSKLRYDSDDIRSIKRTDLSWLVTACNRRKLQNISVSINLFHGLSLSVSLCLIVSLSLWAPKRPLLCLWADK